MRKSAGLGKFSRADKKKHAFSAGLAAPPGARTQRGRPQKKKKKKKKFENKKFEIKKKVKRRKKKLFFYKFISGTKKR